MKKTFKYGAISGDVIIVGLKKRHVKTELKSMGLTKVKVRRLSKEENDSIVRMMPTWILPTTNWKEFGTLIISPTD